MVFTRRFNGGHLKAIGKQATASSSGTSKTIDPFGYALASQSGGNVFSEMVAVFGDEMVSVSMIIGGDAREELSEF